MGEEVGGGQGGPAASVLRHQHLAGEGVAPAEGRVEAGQGQPGVGPGLGPQRRAGGAGAPGGGGGGWGVAPATRRGTATTAAASPARRAKANRCAALAPSAARGRYSPALNSPGWSRRAASDRCVTYSLIRPSSLE